MGTRRTEKKDKYLQEVAERLRQAYKNSRDLTSYPLIATKAINLGWEMSPDALSHYMNGSVEPGIYIPNVGGVRIEDDILIVPGGARRLSSLPRSAAAMSLPKRPRGRK